MKSQREDRALEEAKVHEGCWSGKAFGMLISQQIHLANTQNRSLENKEEEKI